MQERESVVELDAANLFAEAIGRAQGLTPEQFDRHAGPVRDYADRIEEARGEELGFMELPHDRGLLRQVQDRAEELRSWCRNFVVLGIGGSALGNITLQAALRHPQHNLLPPDHPARAGAPRIFVLDNVDPRRVRGLMELLEPELDSTAFNVITKSGSTAETMSHFLHVRDRLRRRDGCDPARQMVLTTDPDPEKSLLRRTAERDGHPSLPIPANVGGRFSVLSAVGLLSAAVSGIDVEQLLAGAAAMDGRCRAGDLYENPAAQYGCALYEHFRRGKNITVLMPYSHPLRALADWYCQLWAESLGKRKNLAGEDVFTGPTPVPAVGVTDQHSVMQLYQDGPFDKVITLVEVRSCGGEQVPICPGRTEEELAYLSGHSYDELLGAELTATRCALRDKERPNCTLRVPRVEPAALGELFMFLEYAVSYSGYLYDVNAFDQPGVELGKDYTYGLMGREGYEPPAL